jgi:hypothetical protein
MSITSNFPAIKPTLLLDFANTKQLDSRITFTRASTATYYGTQTAKAEENLLLQSQDFATTWLTSNSTVAANTTTAPDGTTTADTLTDTTDTGAHIINQSPVLLTSTIYTMSVFLKANTHNFATVTLTNPTTVENGITAVVNLSAGTISETDTGTSATFTSSSITSVGSGWYRVVITGSSVASFSRAEVGFATAATGNTFASNQRISFTGTGTASFFAWGAQLEQRSAATAYTPTTTATITNYVPQLLSAASGIARFDHNPTTFESLGLLIEEQRTNLLTYSEQFDNAAWTKTSTTITANTVIAPDGALSGDLSVADTSSALHAVRATYTGTTTTTYSYSVYAKQASGSYEFVIHFGASSGTPAWNSASRGTARFNLLTGVVVSIGAAGNSTATSGSIVPVGNGWYRCTFVFVPDTTGASTSFSIGQIAAPVSQSVSVSWSGDGTSGAYIWGAQLEAGAFPTSYIPTVASQVTRSADAASMTGTNFSSWYNQGEGTIYAEGFLNNPAITGAQIRRLFEIDDGSNNNRITFGRAVDAGGTLRVIYTVSGTNVNGTNGQTVSNVFPSAKVAAAYEAADYAFSPNGAPVTTSTAANVPVVNRLDIGSNFDNTATTSANGTIRKIAYYPIRCTNAQLQGLTS